MDKEQLLEEAKRKYPIGTKFKCANGNHGDIPNSSGNSNYKDGLWEVINYKCYNGGIHSGNGWITLNSKWAEIVEDTIHPLLLEAEKRYPVGTIFGCVHVDHGSDPINKEFYCTRRKDEIFDFETKDKLCIALKSNNQISRNEKGWCKTVYYKSEWAKIIGEKSEFKKDDYIVFTKVQSESKAFPVNFIFKQKIDKHYLCPYLDVKGSDNNSWEYHRSFNKNYKGYKTDWRYATKEEIAEYDRLGKPYDVTLLNKKERIPDYVECIEEVKSYYGKLGLIYIVLGENHHGSDYNIKGSTSGSVSKKRFKPSTKEAYEKQNQKEEIQYYEILKESSGYKRGDIGKKIKNEYDGIILFVPNRKSISAYNPNVWFSFDNVRPSTEQDFLEQNQEDICDKCKDQFFDGSVNTGPHNLCEGSKCSEAQESYLDDLPMEDLPNISIDEFKLPEKWCVKRTVENSEVLNDWNNNHPLFERHKRYVAYSIVNSDYFYSDRSHTHNYIKDYTEITFKQFKEYVLKTIRSRLKIGDTIEDDLFGIGTIISFDNDYFKVDKWSKKPHHNGKFQYNSDIAINAKIITKTEEWIPKEGEWVTWIAKSLNNSQRTYKLSKYISENEWSLEYEGRNNDYKANIYERVRKAESYEIPKTESIINTIITSTITREIKKGDKLYCIDSVIMSDGKSTVRAIKGKTYISEQDGCFTNEGGIKDHYIPLEFARKHFNFIEEIDYIGGIDPVTLDDPLIGGRPDFSNYDLSDIIITGTRQYNKTFNQEGWGKQYYQQHPLRIEDCFIPKKWDPINSVGQGLWSQIEMPKKDISIERIEPITNSTNPTEFKWEIMNFNQGTQSITQSIERIEPIAPSSLKIIK